MSAKDHILRRVPTGNRTQRSAAQRSAAQRSAAQRSAAQRSAAQRSAAQRSAAQRSAAQRSAAQRSAAQRSAAQRIVSTTGVGQSLPYKELLFQVLLHVVVFIFYSYDRQNPRIESYQVVFFLTYAAAAFVINYFLLPRFLYQNKPLQFVVYVVAVIAVVILLEETVIEKIYFPDTRGQRFLGIFFSLWGVLPVITVLSGGKFAWDALGKQREVDALKATIQESELQFLKSQINPHFLFNNLNNLYSYAIAQSPKTPAIILELSSVLRYMLYECRAEQVPLSKEVEQLENFTKLSELQIEERGEVRFTTQNIQSHYQIAPLILMVFVENAFKHSQAGQSDNICIDIDICLSDEGWLHFRCKNNYQPATNTTDISHGIGLANVRKRLQLLYPDAHRLTIRQTESEYEVQLSMHL